MAITCSDYIPIDKSYPIILEWFPGFKCSVLPTPQIRELLKAMDGNNLFYSATFPTNFSGLVIRDSIGYYCLYGWIFKKTKGDVVFWYGARNQLYTENILIWFADLPLEIRDVIFNFLSEDEQDEIIWNMNMIVQLEKTGPK